LTRPDDRGTPDRKQPPRRSASAEAAAVRWRERHPDEDPEVEPAAAPEEPRDEEGGRRPRHRSASAEAAALRWSERHPDEK
jgi:hypothetical protein